MCLEGIARGAFESFMGKERVVVWERFLMVFKEISEDFFFLNENSSIFKKSAAFLIKIEEKTGKIKEKIGKIHTKEFFKQKSQ